MHEDNRSSGRAKMLDDRDSAESGGEQALAGKFSSGRSFLESEKGAAASWPENWYIALVQGHVWHRNPARRRRTIPMFPIVAFGVVVLVSIGCTVFGFQLLATRTLLHDPSWERSMAMAIFAGPLALYLFGKNYFVSRLNRIMNLHVLVFTDAIVRQSPTSNGGDSQEVFWFKDLEVVRICDWNPPTRGNPLRLIELLNRDGTLVTVGGTRAIPSEDLRAHFVRNGVRVEMVDWNRSPEAVSYTSSPTDEKTHLRITK